MSLLCNIHKIVVWTFVVFSYTKQAMDLNVEFLQIEILLNTIFIICMPNWFCLGKTLLFNYCLNFTIALLMLGYPGFISIDQQDCSNYITCCVVYCPWIFIKAKATQTNMISLLYIKSSKTVVMSKCVNRWDCWGIMRPHHNQLVYEWHYCQQGTALFVEGWMRKFDSCNVPDFLHGFSHLQWLPA